MKVRKAILGLALILGMIGVAVLLRPDSASANKGPHGGYDLATSACAACHRAHTAIGEDLLKADSVYGLCISCHGGAIDAPDVIHGRRVSDNARLNGGGFVEVQATPVTSTHTVEGLAVSGTPSSGLGTAWGGASSGIGVEGTLECTSCHNTHGSTNYRILRDSKNGYPYNNPIKHRWVPDNTELLDWLDNQVVATKDDGYNYAVGDNAYYTSGISYSAGPPSSTTVDPLKGMNAFCSTCHKQYLTRGGSAGRKSNDPPPAPTPNPYFYPGTQSIGINDPSVGRYRHTTAMRRNIATPTPSGLAFDQPIRLAAISKNGADPVANPAYEGFGCTTCHFAHGTKALADGYADEGPTADSALLYYDNRGVCRACHQKDKGPATATPTAVPPTPTATPTP